jgi:glutathione S-transferase
MGLLPILEVDDTVLCSSKAIAGYIAEVTGKSAFVVRIDKGVSLF